MICNKTIVGLGAGMVALLFGGDLAFADSRRSEVRQSLREVHRSRAEYRKELAELRRDRAELRRDIRRGAPRHEIARERANVRESFKDAARSRRELRHDYADLRRDLNRHGAYGRPHQGDRHSGWWRHDSRWDRSRFAPRHDDRASRHRWWSFYR